MTVKMLILAGFVATAALSFGGPKIEAPASVSVRDAAFVVVQILDSPDEIDPLVVCLRRAKKVGVSDDHGAFSHKLDIDHRWLYDAERGEFMRLSKAVQPVYRLSETDRVAVNALIGIRKADSAATSEAG